MINLEVNLRTAAAIRQVLYREQELYTYDPTCVPERITEIREAIVSLDKQIDDALEYETNSK